MNIKKRDLSNDQIKKKLKVCKKKISQLEERLDSELKDKDELYKKIEFLEKRFSQAKVIQEKLMHNLRLVMRRLDLSPKKPR